MHAHYAATDDTGRKCLCKALGYTSSGYGQISLRLEESFIICCFVSAAVMLNVKTSPCGAPGPALFAVVAKTGQRQA